MEVLTGELKGLLSLRPMCPGGQDTPAREGAGALEARARSLGLPLQAHAPHPPPPAQSVNIFFLTDRVTFLYIQWTFD